MSLQNEFEELTEKILQQCERERKHIFDDTNKKIPLISEFFDPRQRLHELKYVNNVREYVTLNKTAALCCFQEHNELEGISHLVESHAVHLRQQIIYRHSKTEIKKDVMNVNHFTMDSTNINFDLSEDVWNGKLLLSRLKELPEDWYIVQITKKYKPYTHECSSLLLPLSKYVCDTEPIHVSFLPTGKSAFKPICVTLPKPKNDEGYDIMKEMGTVIYYLKADLKRQYEKGETYWSVREKHDNIMKTAMKELENNWLKEMRVLLISDFADEPPIVTNILKKLEKIISEYSNCKEITTREKWLLKKVTLGAIYLNKIEIARAVKYTLPNHLELGSKIVQLIYENLPKFESLRHIKRKTLVLIVDEELDHIPFEMLTILKNEPVTRMPCLSIAYTLYKENKRSIVKGCKLIEVSENVGTFIVNPAGDLAGTEKRLRVFNNYWLNDWNGLYGTSPSKEEFEKALVDFDILMFNGHGSGIQYLSGEQIEKIRAKASALLFGCGSAALKPLGGQYSPVGISNQYLMSYSPCILGMLWVVTDTDIDRMTVNFLSQWLKSKASYPWSSIDENSWIKGTLNIKNPSAKNTNQYEPEMLRAVASSRYACNKFMTSASIVVRGLPVKLVYK